jgi:hypothetical protein
MAWGGIHRRFNTKSIKVLESKAMDALRDEGYLPPCRLSKRHNSIPNTRDEFVISGYKECPSYEWILDNAIHEVMKRFRIKPNRLALDSFKKWNDRLTYDYWILSKKGKVIGTIQARFKKHTNIPLVSLQWKKGTKYPFQLVSDYY